MAIILLRYKYFNLCVSNYLMNRTVCVCVPHSYAPRGIMKMFLRHKGYRQMRKSGDRPSCGFEHLSFSLPSM